MKRQRVRVLLTGGAAVAGFLAGPLALASQASPTTGGNYTAVTPYRLDDTRAASGFPDAGKTLGAGGTITLQVANTGGPGGIPTTANTAVLNVTELNATAPSFITAYPAGDSLPSSGIPTWSNLNFVAGQSVSNLVTVPLGTDGQVTLYNYQGSADVVVDAEGFYTSYSAASGSGLYNGVTPYRVFGTVAAGAAIGEGTTQTIAVTGADGVPANATAVVAQLTVAGGSESSFLTAYPTGATLPGTSNLTFAAGQTESTRDIIGVGTGGDISLYNYLGSVNVDVDISGYYTGAAGLGSVLVDITPQRLADTRTSFNGTPIGPGATEEFNLANSVIPNTSTGVAANFTVIPGTGPGYITVSSSSVATTPGTSDVNWPSNSGPVANYTQTDPPLNSDVNVYNYTAGGTINVAIDAFGYFLTAGASPTPTPTPIPVSTSAVSTSDTSITANGVSTLVVTATVTGPDGAPVAGDLVRFTAAGHPAGVCSTATLPAVAQTGLLTDAFGQASFEYTSSTTPGFCTITSVEESTGSTATIVFAQTTV